MIPAAIKKPELSLRPDATYLLPGGLGGLGRSLAVRMAARGARYMVFTSRSGSQKPEAQELLANLEGQGVKTKAFACDIGDENEFRRVLDEIGELGFPKIAGAVTFAMQIQVSLNSVFLFSSLRPDLMPVATGCLLREHDCRRVPGCNTPQGQRHPEHAQIVTRGSGFLHLHVVGGWYCWI